MITEDSAYLLNLDGRCNQKCLFCMKSRDISRHRKITFEEVQRHLLSAKKNGFKKIDFFGGEPTSYHFLLDAILLANSLGLSCTLATNAVRFAEAKYAKNFFSSAKIDAVRTTLHSHHAAIHDKITQRPGSFASTIMGIKNILSHLESMRLCVNIVITRLNIDELANIFRFIYALGVPAAKISGLCYRGRLKKNLWLSVDYSKIQQSLQSALRIGKKLGLLLFFEKLPICLFDSAFVKDSQIIQENYPNFIKLPFCRKCHRMRVCPGFEKNALRLFGIPHITHNEKTFL